VLGHKLGSSPAKPASSAAKQLTISDPYATGGTWYKGNLHVASVRGVGKDLPKVLSAWYAAHGYAFLGISDMNTYAWPEEYANRALPGVPMVNATYAFADVLAVGIDHWLPAQTLQGAIDWIAADGGLPVLAAPLAPAKPQSLLSVMGLHGLYGLEVYDARLALAGEGGADATELWDRLLSAGNRVFAFAGDDATGVSDPAIGGAWISVLAPALLSPQRARQAGCEHRHGGQADARVGQRQPVGVQFFGPGLEQGPFLGEEPEQGDDRGEMQVGEDGVEPHQRFLSRSFPMRVTASPRRATVCV